jgi:hypothetical protein
MQGGTVARKVAGQGLWCAPAGREAKKGVVDATFQLQMDGRVRIWRS